MFLVAGGGEALDLSSLDHFGESEAPAIALPFIHRVSTDQN